ncbi:hypothetical protein OJ253_3210, partial [Cryptosporidium canis]
MRDLAEGIDFETGEEFAELWSIHERSRRSLEEELRTIVSENERLGQELKCSSEMADYWKDQYEICNSSLMIVREEFEQLRAHDENMNTLNKKLRSIECVGCGCEWKRVNVEDDRDWESRHGDDELSSLLDITNILVSSLYLEEVGSRAPEEKGAGGATSGDAFKRLEKDEEVARLKMEINELRTLLEKKDRMIADLQEEIGEVRSKLIVERGFSDLHRLFKRSGEGILVTNQELQDGSLVGRKRRMVFCLGGETMSEERKEMRKIEEEEEEEWRRIEEEEERRRIEEEEKERRRLLEEEEKERRRIEEEEERRRIEEEEKERRIEEEEEEKERRRLLEEEEEIRRIEEEKERRRLLEEEEKERRRIEEEEERRRIEEEEKERRIEEEEEEKERRRLLEEEKERRRIEEEKESRIKQVEKEDVLDLDWGDSNWGESEEIGNFEEDEGMVNIVNGDISCKRDEEIEVDGVRRSTLGFTSFLDDFVSHISGSIKDDDTENRKEEEEDGRVGGEGEDNGASFRDNSLIFSSASFFDLPTKTSKFGNNISSFTGFVSNIKSFFNDDRSKYMVDWNLKKIQDNQSDLIKLSENLNYSHDWGEDEDDWGSINFSNEDDVLDNSNNNNNNNNGLLSESKIQDKEMVIHDLDMNLDHQLN